MQERFVSPKVFSIIRLSPTTRAPTWVYAGRGRLVSYPVTSSLGDIFTNFLGRKTQGTNLGRKGGGGTDLTSGGTEVAVLPSRQHRLAHRSKFEIARSNRCCDGVVGDGGQACVHDLHLIGVELGSCTPSDCQ